MPTVDVVTTSNKKAGSVELAPAVFEAPVKPHLFHAEVTRQLAKRRRGTHSTKNRAAVSGGGTKPWKQKGTGRARQGTIRAPQWKGGGSVFGPVPRDYDASLNKKARSSALRGALSQRLQEGALTVVDGFELPEFKTREIVERLHALGFDGAKVLIVIDGKDERIERSARNLPWVKVLRVEGLNVYDVLWSSRVVLTQAAVGRIEARLTPSSKRGRA